jgi:ActR/RegA family two-component response regulator
VKTHNQFEIVVLEDNDFYNTLLTRQLQSYIGNFAADKGFEFTINSYTNPQDCLRNLKPETDIAIVDYYLGESKNALDILKVIRQKCEDCKVIIISGIKNIKTSYQTLNEGAAGFVFKDRDALNESCVLVEHIINDRLQFEV